jgi:6-phosphogluconolactonase
MKNEELVQRFVDQELSAGERIQFVVALGRDQDLREHVLALEQLVHDAAKLPRPVVPEGFAARVLERTTPPVESGFLTAGASAKAVMRKTLFDLMLLGLGEDAHIASIFPGSELLERANEGRAAAMWVPHLNVWRITLTPEAILDSQAMVVLVAGTNKADAVHAALRAPLDVMTYPAQLLRTAGDRVEWFIDRAAGSRV